MRLLKSLLTGLLLTGPAAAEQTNYEVVQGGSMWTFDVVWTDAAGERQQVLYSLTARLVTEDLASPMTYKPKQAAKVAASAVNDWAVSQRAVKLTVSINDSNGVDISGSSKDEAKLAAAMTGAALVRDEALARYLTENDYIELDGKILPDHARHVADYADALKPLVDALGGPTDDPRELADLALSFVQSIPYEQRALVSDGYRRPLSILGRNIGDCDSKTVLYLAMMRQAYPELPLAIVYVKGHAYGALGLEAQRGDRSFSADGQRWVAVEPVGPAVAPVGELGRDSRRRSRFGRRQVRVIGD